MNSWANAWKSRKVLARERAVRAREVQAREMTVPVRQAAAIKRMVRAWEFPPRAKMVWARGVPLVKMMVRANEVLVRWKHNLLVRPQVMLAGSPRKSQMTVGSQPHVSNLSFSCN